MNATSIGIDLAKRNFNPIGNEKPAKYHGGERVKIGNSCLRRASGKAAAFCRAAIATRSTDWIKKMRTRG